MKLREVTKVTRRLQNVTLSYGRLRKSQKLQGATGSDQAGSYEKLDKPLGHHKKLREGTEVAMTLRNVTESYAKLRNSRRDTQNFFMKRGPQNFFMKRCVRGFTGCYGSY